MFRYISQFRPSFIRSLTYMLQASEYNTTEYLKWFHRTKNFTQVETRKQLDFTTKVQLIIAIFWLILTCWLVISFLLGQHFNWLIGIASLLATPLILAYGIIIPVKLGQLLVQKPIEQKQIKEAKEKLQKINAKKIAIVGSYGKTTMKEILNTVLSQGKKVKATTGNQNTPAGISKFIQNLDGTEEILIFECGEYYPGDIKNLCQLILPDIGIVTGINQAHLSKFKDLNTTVATIYEIKDYVKPENLYINGENTLAKQNAPQNSHIYSKTGISNWNVVNSHTNLNGTTINLNNSLELNSKLIGSHQIGPLALASFLANSLGLTNEQIKTGINNTKPFKHRLQPNWKPDGSVIIDDSYNGNPDGTKASIDFLKTLTNKTKIYITPGLVEMGNQTETVHIELGADLAKANIDKVFLIQNSTTEYIKKGLEQNNFQGDLKIFPNMLDLINKLPNLLTSNTVALIQNDWPDNYS